MSFFKGIGSKKKSQVEDEKLLDLLSGQEGGSSRFSIIGNAIPKSGTYLLNSIFKYFGCWVDNRIHILPYETYQFHDHRDTSRFSYRPEKVISNIKSGYIFAAHLPFTNELKETLKRSTKVKHVFMYRDPRDIMVSYMKFSTYSAAFRNWERPRKEQDFMKTFFSNDEQRLTYVIPKIVERDNWENYAPWLEDPQTYSLSFESLYSDLVNLQANEVGATLKGLLDYIEVDLKKVNWIDFKNKVLGNGFTSSGEKNKLEQYKRIFTQEHYELIDNPIIDNALELFGYKKYKP